MNVHERHLEKRQIECQGKYPYSSFGLAAKIAHRRNTRHDQERLTAYHCRWCASFHVGTRDRSAFHRRPARVE